MGLIGPTNTAQGLNADEGKTLRGLTTDRKQILETICIVESDFIERMFDRNADRC